MRMGYKKRKRPYLVSQAFVIVSQLSRALGPLRIRKSEEHAATKGWSPMHFILSRRENKSIPHHGEPLLVIGMR